MRSFSFGEEHGPFECELCGKEATHKCTCQTCLEMSGEDDHGKQNDGVFGDGRWLCDECAMDRERL